MIDLSRLPAPNAIEPLDIEAIVAARLAALGQQLGPDFTAFLHSDPLAGDQIVQSLFEFLLRARVNDATRATMLAFARGADLDHIAGTFGVDRLVDTPATADDPAVMESDERLRRRVQLSFEAFSTAGSAGAYVFHALSAAPALADATAVKTAPGEVTVTLLGAAADMAPTPAEIDAVRRRLSADTVRPLTDVVVVRAPTVMPTTITVALTILPGPDAEVVRAEAEARIRALVAETRRLGADLQRSAIFARAHVAGVHHATVAEPAADIAVDRLAAVRVTAVTVTIAGSAE